MSRTHVTLDSTYLQLDDSPAQGSVQFVLVATLENTGDNVMYPPITRIAPLDPATGSFSIILPATNDTDTNPSGLTYHVTEVIVGVKPNREYNIVLDHSLGTSQHLPDLVPTTALPLVQYVQLVSKVVAGPVNDASFATTPPDGTVALDSTDNRLYVRVNNIWKSVTVA